MGHSKMFVEVCEQARAQVAEVEIDIVEHVLADDKSAVLIDVREDCEWDKGHIRGAVHIGRGVLERDIEKNYPDKDTRIILYCGGGYRSALAAVSLEQMGYTNVESMAGGFRAWSEANKAVTLV